MRRTQRPTVVGSGRRPEQDPTPAATLLRDFRYRVIQRFPTSCGIRQEPGTGRHKLFMVYYLLFIILIPKGRKRREGAFGCRTALAPPLMILDPPCTKPAGCSNTGRFVKRTPRLETARFTKALREEPGRFTKRLGPVVNLLPCYTLDSTSSLQCA